MHRSTRLKLSNVHHEYNVEIRRRQDLPQWNKHQGNRNKIKITYLVGVGLKEGRTDEDIKSRINKARFTFNSLPPI